MNYGTEDHSVEQMCRLLKEMDPRHDINKIITKAKKWLDLERLFDDEINDFRNLGVPDRIVNLFVIRKEAVIKNANGMTIGEKNIPFLPVITCAFRSIDDLMAMIRNKSLKGRSGINQAKILDMVTVPPNGLYYIYDISLGIETRDKDIRETREILEQQKRSPLTVAETIAFAVHTDAVSVTNLWAIGSFPDESTEVPCIGSNYDREEPTLRMDRPTTDIFLRFKAIMGRGWTSPSCNGYRD